MIILITAIVLIIYASQVLRYGVHMFQQNGYKNRVHLKWVKENYLKHFTACLSPGKAKKPLVYTPRVIRLLVTTVIWFFIICFINRWLGNNTTLLIVAAVYTFLIAPFAPVISNIINTPIEKTIAGGFIRKAKRTLEKMPELTVIGITGSYGKTSVKFYLKDLLSSKFEVLATPESYNTPMGVVKTINTMLRPTHSIFICEMGARNVGDIRELCDIVHPDFGIVTSIGPQHLESFGSIENIQDTKFELPESVYEKTGEESHIFLNGDNEYITSYSRFKDAVTYSLEGKGSYNASDITTGRLGTEFTLTAPDGTSQRYAMKLIGEHNVMNVAGALAVCHEFGIALKDLVIPVRRLKGVEHRLKLIEQSGLTIIDDAYNSNPAGAKAALDTLSMFEDDMKIVITPGMVELGEKQEELNRAFGAQMAETADHVVIVDNKNTAALQSGLEDAGYAAERIRVAPSFIDAMRYVQGLPGEAHKVVLLENDLTDNLL